MFNKADQHYRAIQVSYRERRAKRSGVRYMNHIDEGLAILTEIDAGLTAHQAFCIHPIVQADRDFRQAFSEDSIFQSYKVDPGVVALAVEYRVVANAYLSDKPVPFKLENILLSTLPEVNFMLIADKVQNRKDFELYHASTHPRSKAIQNYFVAWLQRLGISQEQYIELALVADKENCDGK